MARASMVGAQDFEKVNALVGDGAKVGEAIQRVAAERGASHAAVSANFYAAKRRSGGGRRREPSSPTSSPPRQRSVRSVARRAPRPTGQDGSLDAIATELVRNVQMLADAVKAQEDEVAHLRTRLEGVRQVLG